jgi:competence ComEA-like helix-hairpin-helix protein
LPGQININTASLVKLQEIEQIGPTRARELVNLRPFDSIEDLDRVPGIGASTIARIKAQGLACVE